jgi:5-methyltetrahydropteroyltriglutamate--homocysteine methyltransferase
VLVVLKPEQLWVNPDCGLKTRNWKEIETCLKNMVESARALRMQVGDKVQTAR